MNFKQRIYLARTISNFGDWMTFLVSALWVSHHFGADKVPLVFLLSSVPPLIFSRLFGSRIYFKHLPLTFAALQLLLAVNVISLALGTPSLYRFYVYILVASTIGSMGRPAWDTLLGRWFTGEERKEVFTRTGAINSSLLILAPISGATLAEFIGYNAVFILDGLSFIALTIILARDLKRPLPIGSDPNPKAPLPASPSEWHLPRPATTPIAAWYALLIMGALINGCEFFAFKQFGYQNYQIGFVLASWGAGGLCSFMFSKSSAKYFSELYMPLLLAASLGSFLLIQNIVVSCILFSVSGFINSHLGGAIRAKIQNQMDHYTLPSPAVWSLLSQRLSMINITAYFICSLVLAHISLHVFAVAILMSGIICYRLIQHTFESNLVKP